MRSFDTNLVLRLMIEDDHEDMSRAAFALLKSEGAYISKSVLLEAHWFLRKRLRRKREEVGQKLKSLLATRGVETEDTWLCRAAVDAMSAGIEFDDAMHVLSSKAGAAFTTFDKALVKRWPRLNRPEHVVYPESITS